MIESAKLFNPGRLLAVMAVFGAWSLLIAGRAVQFQVFQHKRLSALAVEICEKEISIPARRGIIYDSQKRELATSVTVSNVIANPAEIGKIEDIRTTAEKLAPILEIGSEVLSSRIAQYRSDKRLILAAKAVPSVAQRIRDLKLKGIYLENESLRFYPYQDMLCQTLGFINKDGEGAAGLESRYNIELKGISGTAIRKVDAFGRSYGQRIIKSPLPGCSLVLSIDHHIQRLTEKALEAGMKRSGAAAGVAIVMESETGRILALANYPGFDCNAYLKYDTKTWRNRAIQDVFEPGSTMKVAVISGALDAGLVKLNEGMNCQMGSMKIAGHVFHDHEPFAWLTVQQALERSSNICAAKVGLRLGDMRLHQVLSDFGFGSRTNIDLPGESKGRLRILKQWSPLSIPSISFGQEVSVTSIQMLAAINAIANGGYRVRPSLIDCVLNENGETVYLNTPKRTRIIRSETAADMRIACEGVVLRGTAPKASLEGYRTGGKTGTAQKAEGKHYSKSKYTASFIGFAPLPRPRVTILVQVDEPKGLIYGGEVAAPIYRQIAQETLSSLQVPPDRNLLAAETSSSSRLSASDRSGPSRD